jgi:hypothetical protein
VPKKERRKRIKRRRILLIIIIIIIRNGAKTISLLCLGDLINANKIIWF